MPGLATGLITGPDGKGVNPPLHYTQAVPGPSANGIAVQAVNVQQPVPFYDLPFQMCCPSCSKMTVTQMTHLALLWQSVSAGRHRWLLLCPILCRHPQDEDHDCPNRKALLGDSRPGLPEVT